MLKKKLSLLLTFLAGFLFWSNNTALALEVSLKGLSSTSSLGDYAGYIFAILISLAGALSAISFAIGAIGLMISGDSAEASSNAKDRMKGAIIGLILTMASFLIINTINPQLAAKFTPTKLPTVTLKIPPPPPGIYFYAESGCSGDNSGAITGSEEDLGGLIGADQEVKSFKIIDDPDNQISYGIILHAEGGLENGGECSKPITDAGCNENDIKAQSADIFQINEDSAGSSGNGVTFYSGSFGWAGQTAGFYEVLGDVISTPSYQEAPGSMCFDYTNVDQPDAYKYKCAVGCTSPSECPGSTCNTATGWCMPKPGAASCGGSGNKKGKEGIDCSASACVTFQDCPGSMDIKGDYLVGIYSAFPKTDKKNAGKTYCQTFNGTSKNKIGNFNTEPIIAAGSLDLDSIYIIPTK